MVTGLSMSGSHSYQGYSVLIGKDGSIQVKSGDTISGYSAAMHRIDVTKTQTHWGEFGRMSGTAPMPLTDPNRISAGEKLYHIPTFHTGSGKTLIQRLKSIAPLNFKPAAKCMINKAISLEKLRIDAGREDAVYMDMTAAIRAAKYGELAGSFDYSFAEKALDRMASHVLTEMHKNNQPSVDDHTFAQRMVDMSNRITSATSQIRSLTRSVGQLNKPHRSALDAWMLDRLRDPKCIMNCHKSTYGI